MQSPRGEQSVARLGFGETPFDQPLTRHRDAEVDEDDDELYGVGPSGAAGAREPPPASGLPGPSC